MDQDDALRGQDISAAVSRHGWRLVLGQLCTAVAVSSLAEAVTVAGRVLAVAGPRAGERLRLDLRDREVLLAVQSPAGSVGAAEVELAQRIATALIAERRRPEPGAARGSRSAQVLEIAIDALDIPAVRPFWKAVLAYADDPGAPDGGDAASTAGLVDPRRQGPAVWFQQMDAERPQRNRIHLDVSVPHDEAPDRIRAALQAGGTMVSSADAPAFWVLADAEGNEACVTTWQGRD